MGGNGIKLAMFADDMTSFVRDKMSYLALFETLKLFGTYFSLKINHDKTEILLLGDMEASCSELDVKEISKAIKILGVNFTYNYSLFYKLNFESIEKYLRGLLKGWGWRGLTLLGKIQVIKSFAIPKSYTELLSFHAEKTFSKKLMHYFTLLFGRVRTK